MSQTWDEHRPQHEAIRRHFDELDFEVDPRSRLLAKFGQTPVPCDNLMEWAQWVEASDRLVMRTRVLGLAEVSTVFLALDHRHFGDGPPILFETMVFWLGEKSWEMERCSTWAEAEEQHRRTCAEAARPRSVLEFVRRTIRDHHPGSERRLARRMARTTGNRIRGPATSA